MKNKHWRILLAIVLTGGFLTMSFIADDVLNASIRNGDSLGWFIVKFLSFISVMYSTCSKALEFADDGKEAKKQCVDTDLG